jgi:hypothetical protein
MNEFVVQPRIGGIKHVVNTVFEQRTIDTANGQQSVIGKSDPLLTVSIGYVDPTGTVNGGEAFTFAATAGQFASVSEVMTASKVDMRAVWEAAFDAAKEKFNKTKDQPPSAKERGVTWYPRVDMVEAALQPGQPMALTMMVGCYADAGYTKLRSTFAMTFVDSATMIQHNNQKTTLLANIAQMDDMLAGTHASQLGMDVEALGKSKLAAANDKAVYQTQLAQRNGMLIAPLSDVLGLPAVQQAFVAVGRVVFTELKRVQPEWADISVDKLMEDFLPAFAAVVQA